MDFLDFMKVMFSLNEQFEGMTWHTSPGNIVTIKVPVTPEITQMLNAGREMFAEPPC